MIDALTVELGSDESGFVIEGPVPLASASPVVPGNTLVAWWPDTDPELTGLVVSTGSQWGPFAVSVEVWDADPGPADAPWEDVVELSVSVVAEVTINEIVDGPVAEVTPPPGDYRLRVAAAGRTESAARDGAFDDDEADDDREALERFLITLWPAPPSVSTIVREDSRFAREQQAPAPAPAPSPVEVASLDAAWAVVRDLRGDRDARPLPGGIADLEVEVEVAGTPQKVFNRVRGVFGWPYARGGMFANDPAATGYHDATLPDLPGAYEQVGHVATTLVSADKPRQVVLRWNWVLDGPGPLTERSLLLADDSIVTLDLEKVAGADDPAVRVRLTQVGAPRAWVDDLARLWTHQLLVAAAR